METVSESQLEQVESEEAQVAMEEIEGPLRILEITPEDGGTGDHFNDEPNTDEIVETKDPYWARVEVSVVFSRTIFLGVDLCQQKTIRSELYRFEEYLEEIKIEELTLETVVLVVDDDKLYFERAVVSAIARRLIEVDYMDCFRKNQVSRVYVCPSEIARLAPAITKYRLRAEPPKDPLQRGQRFDVTCFSLEDDVVIAEVSET